MIVLGINGSPRRGGNTDILLRRLLEGAEAGGADTDIIVLNDLKFVPCQECARVRDDGTCKVQDDMQTVYEKVTAADAVVLASPIFFGSLSAQTKMMIDRYQCLWRARFMLETVSAGKKRPGAFLCVEASERRDFFENARSIVRHFFATIDVACTEELLCTGVDEKGKMQQRGDYLQEAFEMGQRLAAKTAAPA